MSEQKKETSETTIDMATSVGRSVGHEPVKEVRTETTKSETTQSDTGSDSNGTK